MNVISNPNYLFGHHLRPDFRAQQAKGVVGLIMGKTKKSIQFLLMWLMKNWLLLLVAFLAYNAMISADAARGSALRASDSAADAAYYAEEASQNAVEAATQATDAAHRARQIYFSI